MVDEWGIIWVDPARHDGDRTVVAEVQNGEIAYFEELREMLVLMNGFCRSLPMHDGDLPDVPLDERGFGVRR